MPTEEVHRPDDPRFARERAGRSVSPVEIRDLDQPQAVVTYPPGSLDASSGETSRELDSTRNKSSSVWATSPVSPTDTPPQSPPSKARQQPPE